MALPSAHAFERDWWHDTQKALDDLYPRMDEVDSKLHRFGASHEVRDEITRLHQGIRDVTDHVKTHDMDPKEVYKRSQDLADLMARVEHEYHDHIERMRAAEHLDHW